MGNVTSATQTDFERKPLENLVHEKGFGDCIYLIANNGRQWGLDKHTIRWAEDANELVNGVEEDADPIRIIEIDGLLLARNEQREAVLREVVDYVANLGCDDYPKNCECVTCKAMGLRERVSNSGGCIYHKR